MFDYDFKFYNMSHITNEEFMKKEINVVVTGAAGQIGYSLIPRLIDGNLFKDTIVNLSLVEIPQVVEKLEGLAMELDDSYFPHLGSIDIYDDFSAALHIMEIGFYLWEVFLEVLSIKEKKLRRDQIY